MRYRVYCDILGDMNETDKKEIKELFNQAIEPFARVVQGEFVVQRRYFDEKLQEVKLELKDDVHYIHSSLDVIHRELQEIRSELSKVVYRHELEAVTRRVDEIERKMAAMSRGSG